MFIKRLFQYFYQGTLTLTFFQNLLSKSNGVWNIEMCKSVSYIIKSTQIGAEVGSMLIKMEEHHWLLENYWIFLALHVLHHRIVGENVHKYFQNHLYQDIEWYIEQTSTHWTAQEALGTFIAIVHRQGECFAARALQFLFLTIRRGSRPCVGSDGGDESRDGPGEQVCGGFPWRDSTQRQRNTHTPASYIVNTTDGWAVEVNNHRKSSSS